MSAPQLPPLLSPRSVELVLPSRSAAPAPPPPPPQPFTGRRASSLTAIPSSRPPAPPLFAQSSAFSFPRSPLSAINTGDGAEGQPHTPHSLTNAALTPTHASRPTPLLLSQHRQDGIIAQLLKMGFTASAAERAVSGPGVSSMEVAVERALQAQEEDEEAHQEGHAADEEEEEKEGDEEDSGADEEVKQVNEEVSELPSAQPATTTERHSPSIDVALTISDGASASFSPTSQWQCASCTLVNSLTRRRCEVCNARRPNSETPTAAASTPKVKPATYVDSTAAAAVAVKGEVRLSSTPCQICFDCVPVGDVVDAPCAHLFCRDCMVGYVTAKVNDGHVLNVHCPYPACARVLSASDFLALLPSDLNAKYERFRTNAEVALDPSARWCPTAGCDSVLKRGKGKGADKLKCGKCKRALCFSCNEEWHDGRTCEQAANGVMAAYRRSHDVRQCPECHTTIERSEGCNHMTCTRCHFQFCWLCCRRYSKHHFAFWNLFGCPGLQDGSLSWLGNDRVCCVDCGCGCGCAGVVKRAIYRVWLVFTMGVLSVALAVPTLLGALACAPCLVWRWRKHKQAKRERREQRDRERAERQKRRRERALARDEIDETGRVLEPHERRERRRLRREAMERKEVEEAIRLSQADVAVRPLPQQGSVPLQSPRSMQFKTLADLPLGSPVRHVETIPL